MKNRIIANRYGEGFISYAKTNIGIEKAVDEFKNLQFIISQNPEFQDFLENLEITYHEKCEVVDNVLKDFSEEIRQFLKLLLDNRRINCLTDIADYIRMAYAYGEAVEAVLKSTYPLDLVVIQKIKSRLENILKKKLNLYLELDPEILGGVQVIIGNTVIDGSLRRRLDELSEKLMAVKVN